MQVRHILHGKGRDVVAIAGTATICDAAKLLIPTNELRTTLMSAKGTAATLLGIGCYSVE